MPEPASVSAQPSRVSLGGVKPILRVADLDASVEYYVARLGFEVEWKSDTMVSVRRGSTSLMLCSADQGQPGSWLWISTSDVDELYAELSSRGAILRHPPTNHPWGSRECQIADPDGHVLRFGADLREGEPMGDFLDGGGRLWRPSPDGSWSAAE